MVVVPDPLMMGPFIMGVAMDAAFTMGMPGCGTFEDRTTRDDTPVDPIIIEALGIVAGLPQELRARI